MASGSDSQKLLSADVIRESVTSYIFDYHSNSPRCQQQDEYGHQQQPCDETYEAYQSDVPLTISHAPSRDPPLTMSHAPSRDELRSVMQLQLCSVSGQ